MRYVKWTFWTLLTLFVIAFLHYTLPQHDVVRITGTYEKRIDPGENSIFWAAPDSGNNTKVTNRDVFFIQAIRPNGKPMVYRNEDTGWGWPPYFKFDTANLQTEAADLISTRENPRWVVITHYGWRNEFLSIYPNAVAIREVDGPDVRIIPWFNIFFFIVLGLLALLIRRMWLQFRERMVDPVLEDLDEAQDVARERARGLFARIRAWLQTWRGKPRR